MDCWHYIHSNAGAIHCWSSQQCFQLINKKHLKNVGPIRHCKLPHTHSPVVASGTVARRLRIDVHDITNDNDDNDKDNDNAWQRGPLWPHKMGPTTTVYWTLPVLRSWLQKDRLSILQCHNSLVEITATMCFSLWQHIQCSEHGMYLMAEY